MTYDVLPVVSGVTTYNTERDQYIQQGIKNAHDLLAQYVYNVVTPTSGIDATGATSARAGIQSALNLASSGGYRHAYIGPGTFLIDSATDGTNGYGLVVPPGLSVWGAGAGRTTFDIGGSANLNLFMIRSTLSTTAVATITSDWSVTAKTFTCSGGLNGIAQGDTVATRLAQNPSDAAEARQTKFAKVTAASGTSITIDTPAEWGGAVGSIAPVNKTLTKVTAIAERMSIGGFHVVGAANLRHVVGTQWGRGIRYFDITADDPGSGVLNLQWLDGWRADDIYSFSSSSFGNPNKGRVISISNVTNGLVGNVNSDYPDAFTIYAESFCKNVVFQGVRVHNRGTTRTQQAHIFSGIGCNISVKQVEEDGWNTAAPGNDSLVSFGAAPAGFKGQCHLEDVEVYKPLSMIRAVPLWNMSGNFRCFDSTGQLRTFNMDRIRSYSVQITLTNSATITAWLPEGLWAGYQVTVPSGVTSTQITGLTLARVAVGSINPNWVANANTLTEQFIGGALNPVASAWTQPTRVQVTTGAAAAGIVITLTLWTVWANDFSPTLATDSASPSRFLPMQTV